MTRPFSAFPPFLDADEHARAAAGWRAASKQHESGRPTYQNSRYEGARDDEVDLARLHAASFIRTTIPPLIERTAPRKPRILCLADGSALFSEQLRREFGDAIQVYSSGLRKRAALVTRRSRLVGDPIRYVRPDPDDPRRLLRDWDPGMGLHPDDLKWRSILELSDMPEFDLIVDTCGELSYGVRSERELARFITAVARKLRPGGFASLVGTTYDGAPHQDLMDAIERREGVSIFVTFPKALHFRYLFRLFKPMGANGTKSNET